MKHLDDGVNLPSLKKIINRNNSHEFSPSGICDEIILFSFQIIMVHAAKYYERFL